MIMFSELKPGELFRDPEQDTIFMKVSGHHLSNIVNEGSGGHAVDMTNGLLSFYADFEKIEKKEMEDVLEIIWFVRRLRP